MIIIKFPVSDDDELLAVQADLFEQLSRERDGTTRFFRDGDTIFAVILSDSGFGNSSYRVYTYNIKTRKLRQIATAFKAEIVEWIYAE